MSEREWRFYISDMIACAEKVLSYTADMTQTEFEHSSLTYDATIRNIELIGEAATHIPDEVRRQYPDIPWRMMVATRNQLIHGYLGINNDILWNIISTDIPDLLDSLQAI
ncbi:MAG: nucleotidyltransferase [Oceanospirillaceae bacterium]|nr:nucleotidyltransferase [Oceanospirillaceae bacterium]